MSGDHGRPDDGPDSNASGGQDGGLEPAALAKRSAAHDLRNLLAVIAGYAENLLEDLDEQDPKREDVLEIRSAARRAAALTKELSKSRREGPAFPSPGTQEQEHHSVAGGETVLLVEDDGALRRLNERILRHAGYRVLAAEDGPEAVRLCSEHARDVKLLLSDVSMPEMSGPELARRLLEICPGLKTVFVTGNADDAVEQYSASSPNVRLLEKPVAAAKLLGTVRILLDEQD
jgi:CheY-like chemotaxis protein